MKFKREYSSGGLTGKAWEGDFVTAYHAENGMVIKCQYGWNDCCRWYEVWDDMTEAYRVFDRLRDAKDYCECIEAGGIRYGIRYSKDIKAVLTFGYKSKDAVKQELIEEAKNEILWYKMCGVECLDHRLSEDGTTAYLRFDRGFEGCYIDITIELVARKRGGDTWIPVSAIG